MQYENNPANGFRDGETKHGRMVGQPNGRTARHAAGNIPALPCGREIQM